MSPRLERSFHEPDEESLPYVLSRMGEDILLYASDFLR